MLDYKAIFDSVEATLIDAGNRTPGVDMRSRLKFLTQPSVTDAECFRTMVHVVFFSGFRAHVVGKKMSVIDGHFPDYETVANYTEADNQRIMDDPNMIRRKPKIDACISNARVFKDVVHRFNSFKKYVDSFGPLDSSDNLEGLKADLIERFDYLGRVTSCHFMTMMGLPILKPDVVIMRMFNRLGLIESAEPRYLNQAIDEGRAFAKATGYPLRYIDIVFVSYGQVKSANPGQFDVAQEICSFKPHCALCGVAQFCQYEPKNFRT